MNSPAKSIVNIVFFEHCQLYSVSLVHFKEPETFHKTGLKGLNWTYDTVLETGIESWEVGQLLGGN